MEAIEAIMTRRSIRQYSDKEIPKEKIEQILRAAMSAPSARNQQPWEFIVVNDRKILDAIPEFHPYAKMLAQAKLAIIVCGNEKEEKSSGYWVQDCSAATQNILLAAHALGLGAVWLGVYPRDERVEGTRKLFNLPAHIFPLNIISIGFPSEPLQIVDRYNTQRIHINKW